MTRLAHVLVPLAALLVGISVTVPAPASAQERLGLPLWLLFSGTHRTRYEHLRSPFQSTIPGANMALSLRTTLLAELRFDHAGIGVELADSRVYMADDDAPLNTSHVNPVDVLQAYVAATIPGFLSNGARIEMKFGRLTMDVGSRRFVARNRFRNTINAFTGMALDWTSRDAESVRAFVTVPVERRVYSIRDNEPQLDIERTESVFWGVSLRSRPWAGSIRGELQLFGLQERDSEEFQTKNRNFVTPGFRLYRNPGPGLVDFEIESAIQAGTSMLSVLPGDTTSLAHFAFFVHAAVGHTFAGRWQPRLVLQYDYASGDKDPNDDRNGRFDTLFGARRFEYGPTGIYGAFARSNIKSVAVRSEVRPHQQVDGFFAYRPVWLAQARDRWTTTQLWDASGMSGTFLGHQIEGRVRCQILRVNVTIETGFARIWLGGFPRNAPNGIPDLSNPTYVYTQLGLQI